MKAALIQLNTAWESKKANFERADFFVKKAAEEECTVIVFPEMFSTGFSMNIHTVAEEGYGETASLLAGLAKKNNINIIAGFPIKAPGAEKARNMAAVFNRRGLPHATYTKIHPFSYAGEDKYYIAGTDTVVFDIDGMPSSVFICYDLRFPEVFRKVAGEAHAIFVIANWPSERKGHWETLLKARAIENECFIIGVNRTGTDGNGIHYPGASCVIGPAGNVIWSGNETDEFTTCEFDPDEVDRIRSQFPFLDDMKYPEATSCTP
ncbi:MAG: carbon-nitrogen family hydrolase [Nitrospirae bacterium]|nr:carbon-nitrogen family hydrolase [Nitrospirota bacterium]MCL5237596.1 carbon-nitrogen family hydrolase [Nitrospirota bacterium]